MKYLFYLNENLYHYFTRIRKKMFIVVRAILLSPCSVILNALTDWEWFALCAWVFLAFFFRWDWRAWLLFVCCWILSGFFLLFLGGHWDIWKVLMLAERTRRWLIDIGSNRCKRLSYVVQILIWNLIFQFY